MHTFKKNGFTITHNGDYSGGVTISSLGSPEITIPMETLVEFVGNKMKDDAISKLEQMSGSDYLLNSQIVTK